MSYPQKKNRLGTVSKNILLEGLNRVQGGPRYINDSISTRAFDRLFVYVNQTRLGGPTYRAFTNLLDNYERYIGVQESQPSANLQEIETFLDEILGTEVMTIAFAYLSSEGTH